MKRKVAEIILILLFYLIQVTFGNAIGIGGITPVSYTHLTLPTT